MTSNKNGIDCIYHSNEKRSFYVDEDLNVLPCCFYAHAQLSPPIGEHEKDHAFDEECKINPGWNNLGLHTFEQIKENKIYKHHIFHKGWNSDNPSGICYFMCGHGRSNPQMVKKELK